MPIALLAYTAFATIDGLGANPVETLSYFTGSWALRFLLLTLLMTPLRWIPANTTGQKPWRWPLQIRRALGLYAFAWALCHFLIYLLFDLSLELSLLGKELAKRPYITLGFIALCLLTPMAVTSTKGWQRRLGKQWKRLHKLVYPAICLACTHYLWQLKSFHIEAIVYAAIAASLLLLRWPPIKFRVKRFLERRHVAR